MPDQLSIISREPDDRRKALGDAGEALARRFLEAQGYTAVLTNFKIPVGRNSRGGQITGEIDIVALDGPVLCFIEVKTRRSSNFAAPVASVDKRKQRQITRTARAYMRTFKIRNKLHRYDVVSVVLPVETGHPEFELFRNFWSDSDFGRKRWSSLRSHVFD